MDDPKSKPHTTDVRFFPTLEEAIEYANGIRQHTSDANCWCFPELVHIDDDGTHYYLHHYEQ